VILGSHVILYSSDADADRAFVGDLLGRPGVDEGWGRLVTIRLPGGGRLGVYEVRHPTAFDA
jgi:hypothetical protein